MMRKLITLFKRSTTGNKTMNLKLMVLENLPRVLEIRNDPETYNFLHTPKVFSLEECQKWFSETNPIWYVIEEDNVIIGYIRTSDWDYVNKSIMIGCDIHKDYRRKGYAFKAYTTFIERLKNAGWNVVKLSVLKTNERAIKLYKKLNFKTVIESEDSYYMELNINDSINSKKGAKVIACYFGNRRSTGTAGRGPYNAKEAYKMYEFIWNIECTVDQGYPQDTIFVINELLPTDPINDQKDVDLCTKLVESFNCKKTANGRAYVLKRPNIGLSFGAFDHAFNMLKQDYDYWLFTEDDQVIIGKNVFKTAIKQLLLPNEKINGFVATVGVNRDWGPGAFGGCGLSSREILKKVETHHFSNYHNRPCLPFYYVPTHTPNVPQTTESHEWYGEVAFTLYIHQMGYYLEDCELPSINVSWGDTSRRTFRCSPYELWMGDVSKEKIETINELITPIADALNGTWVQNNGDKFTINKEICKFNNNVSGSFYYDHRYNIAWENGIKYHIDKDDVLKLEMDITDSNGNRIHIIKES